MTEDEALAVEYVAGLVAAGKAQEIMWAYSEHMQSCAYVESILRHFAYDVDSGISDEIMNFARNLLDDWAK